MAFPIVLTSSVENHQACVVLRVRDIESIRQPCDFGVGNIVTTARYQFGLA